jgi:hypothetical protein
MTSVDSKSSLAAFEGALICKLQKEDVKSDDQSKLLYILLLVAWKSEDYKKYRVVLQLIEYDETFHWYEVKPEAYYQKYVSQLSTYTDPIRDAWSISDSITLITGLELDSTQRDGRLNITISESTSDDYGILPVWIDPER